MAEVRELDFIELLRKGYTDIVVEDVPGIYYPDKIPLNIVARQDYSNEIRIGATPNLILREHGQIRYVVVNGFVFDTRDNEAGSIENTLIIK